jgi:hypothetical protein
MATVVKAIEALGEVKGGLEAASKVLSQLAEATGAARRAREEFLRRREKSPRLAPVHVPDPTLGPLAVLGPCVAIAYRARKDAESVEVDYEHAFGRPLPILCANSAKKLILAGGGYTITRRGIEG